MRLNLRLIGMLHGIILLALIGQFVFRLIVHSGLARRRTREDTPLPVLAFGGMVLGAGLMAIGFIGTFFGSLIKAAVSRQREYLADASAVQFTRNPGGIAGALRKIGGLVGGAHVDNPNAPEMSHLFFGQADLGIDVDVFKRTRRSPSESVVSTRRGTGSLSSRAQRVRRQHPAPPDRRRRCLWSLRSPRRMPGCRSHAP